MKFDQTNNQISNYLEKPEFTPLVLRYLLCQALTPGHEPLADPAVYTHSTDVITLDGCIRALGLEPTANQAERNVHTLICGDSESTLGLLLPVAAALGKNCLFLLDEKLVGDSVTDVLKALKVHGIRHEYISKRSMRIWGRLTAGTFIISAGKESWFLQGLLFALPLLRENSVVMVDGILKDKPDIYLTLKILERAGIQINAQIKDDPQGDTQEAGRTPGKSYVGAIFRIRGSQVYKMNQI